MIFYFSGTGNSAWVARQLAQLTGDEACDITTLTQLPDLDSNRQLGLVPFVLIAAAVGVFLTRKKA